MTHPVDTQSSYGSRQIGIGQRIRIPFSLFRPSPNPATPQSVVTEFANPALFASAGFSAECSAIVWCPALQRKTVELWGDNTDMTAHQVVIQATIFGGGSEATDWYTITAPIAVSGLVPIVIPSLVAAGTNTAVEPELTAIRILALKPEQVPGNAMLPRSLRAVLAATYDGEGPWLMRCNQGYFKS